VWTLDDGGKSYATVESATKWLQLWADMARRRFDPGRRYHADLAETGADSSSLVAGRKPSVDLEQPVGGYQAAMTDKLGATTAPQGR